MAYELETRQLDLPDGLDITFDIKVDRREYPHELLASRLYDAVAQPVLSHFERLKDARATVAAVKAAIAADNGDSFEKIAHEFGQDVETAGYLRDLLDLSDVSAVYKAYFWDEVYYAVDADSQLEEFAFYLSDYYRDVASEEEDEEDEEDDFVCGDVDAVVDLLLDGEVREAVDALYSEDFWGDDGQESLVRAVARQLDGGGVPLQVQADFWNNVYWKAKYGSELEAAALEYYEAADNADGEQRKVAAAAANVQKEVVMDVTAPFGRCGVCFGLLDRRGDCTGERDLKEAILHNRL